jgi:FkbM family methyltransferase
VATSGLAGDACILDLGANIGLASAYLAARLDDPSVTCVEPLEENVRVLEANARASPGSWNIVQAAVSSSVGEGHLYCSDWWSSATLAPEIGRARQLDSNRPEFLSGRVRTVEMLALADLIRRVADDSPTGRVDLLKVDIEGAEAQAIPASESALGLVDRLAIDLHTKYIDPAPVRSTLRRVGLERSSNNPLCEFYVRRSHGTRSGR